jgi:hypothetical protein
MLDRAGKRGYENAGITENMFESTREIELIWVKFVPKATMSMINKPLICVRRECRRKVKEKGEFSSANRGLKPHL